MKNQMGIIRISFIFQIRDTLMGGYACYLQSCDVSRPVSSVCRQQNYFSKDEWLASVHAKYIEQLPPPFYTSFPPLYTIRVTHIFSRSKKTLNLESVQKMLSEEWKKSEKYESP